MGKKKLVYGVGINDANYTVKPTINSEQVCCPFYQSWRGMLQRCYHVKYQAKQPTYIGCSVCEEWLTFSNFKKWMEQQDWKGKELDKDLLVKGNRVYSPETCVFVTSVVNSFTISRGADRGEWPIGVNFDKRIGKFRAKCSNPFTKKKETLGYFNCPDQAYQAWRKRKHELALQLAKLQDNPRVAKALESYYE